jgi:glutaredoxin
MHMRFLAALLLLPALAQAQMYRWVDDSGKVHYSDQVPPSSAKSVTRKSAQGSQSAAPPLPYALQQAVKDFPVTLYTAETCNPCIQARELLNQRGVPYKDVGITDAEGLEKLKNLAGNTSIPVLTIGREIHKGFENAAYQAALDNAGYPKTSQLPAGVQARQSVKPAEKAAPPAATEGNPAAAPEQAPGAGEPK